MKLFSITAFLLFLNPGVPIAFCQQINLYSVSILRQTGGDNGYTLNGNHMINSRAKLLNPNNFGSGGIYSKSIVITDDFSGAGSFSSINQNPDIDILFIGSFNQLDPTMVQISDEELDSLYKWSVKGGKIIIAPQPNVSGYDFSQFNSRWGFNISGEGFSNYIPTLQGSTSVMFNGPFGNVIGANQGGSAQGYFDILPPGSVVFAQNFNGQPTLILDCNTMDLICADVDGYTELGGITSGDSIANAQDRFWVNTIAYMDQLEIIPPVILVNGNELTTGNYASYQWYYEGTPIPEANSSSYTANQDGTYTVQITYPCGCTAISPPVNFLHHTPVSPPVCGLFIPSAFSPNNDGSNDKLRVIEHDVDLVDFVVYNRWGEKIFEAFDVNQGWDGTFMGQKVDQDVFVYYIEARCINSGEVIYKEGNVTLVR